MLWLNGTGHFLKISSNLDGDSEKIQKFHATVFITLSEAITYDFTQ
jgi:hypothetical protein